MLKIQKISMVALLLGTAITTQANVKDPSYAMGVLFGTDMKGVIETQKKVITYDEAKLLAGVKDALGEKVDLNDPELGKTLQALNEKLKAEQQKLMAEQQKVAAEQAQKSLIEGEKFAAEFKKKEGVKETKSGLLYRIEKAGEGEVIKAEDTVKVHYTGKLPNGKVFDSSVERGQPAEFALNQVIAGWTEGLQLVKKGGKIELVIPSKLAYGEQDLGVIPANSTLHFDVEVLDVKPAK